MKKEYFDECEKRIKQVLNIIDCFERKAMFYKHLYEITGLKWAKDRNEYYVTEAEKLLFGSLGICIANIAILENYLKNAE